jgi:hypothetical protein
MRRVLCAVFIDRDSRLRLQVAGIYSGLPVVNLAARAWALVAFQCTIPAQHRAEGT